MIRAGDHVYWKVGEKQLEGRVLETYDRSPRDSSYSGKALLIELVDGRKVLKHEEEVHKGLYRKVPR